MKIQFKKNYLSDKKIMVRFTEGDYEKIRKIAKENKEGMGQIIRKIIEVYLKNSDTIIKTNKVK